MQASENDIVYLIFVITIFILLIVGFLLSFVLLYRQKQAKYKRNIDKLKHDFEKNLLEAKLEMQEETFRHISQEIHDNITLSLSLAKLNIHKFSENNLDVEKDLLESAQQQISKSLNDLSDISKSLDFRVIETHGFMHALETEIDRLQKTGVLKITLLEKGDSFYFEVQKELILFRIVQEAFNNILKHSNASDVWLEMDYSPKEFVLSITDNGVGFTEDNLNSKRKHKTMAGLDNIRMRAAILNGTSEIKSQTGKGTKITISVPADKNSIQNESN